MWRVIISLWITFSLLLSWFFVRSDHWTLWTMIWLMNIKNNETFGSKRLKKVWIPLKAAGHKLKSLVWLKLIFFDLRVDHLLCSMALYRNMSRFSEKTEHENTSVMPDMFPKLFCPGWVMRMMTIVWTEEHLCLIFPLGFWSVSWPH